MLVTIITPTYNRSFWLKEMLSSVLRQDTSGVDFEYLVVDNNSTDDTRKVVEAFAPSTGSIRIQYVREANQGVNQARNTGIALARSDYIIFFDDDILLEDGVLAAYIRAFRTYPDAKVFGGRISVRPPEFNLPTWLVIEGPYARTMIVLRLEHGTGLQVRTITQEDMPIGPSMAFKRSVFQECGVFRTDFGLVGNSLMPGAEYELMLRLKSMGIGDWIYVGDARVLHPIKPSQAAPSYFRKRMFGVGRVLNRLHTMQSRWKILGLPVYVLEFIMQNITKSLAFTLLRRPVEAFYYQCEACMFFGYVYEHFLLRRKKAETSG